ncbi:hypothetical protein [Lysinibacillus irui]|uniref:hypothetical protein n=1 Tax=Lysinibacillus irui TaxID=2998077 RepID=UPI002AD41943|nr:hypothetical protein [Lysinibacillus irui]MEA0563270.1 hypothetical protein [Lysinibacillus irui]
MNGNFTARIGARITEFMARMRQVRETIRSTANDVRVDIGADVSQFNRRMAEIRARIAALTRDRVVVKIEARIENFQRKIQRIATDIRAFGELMQHTLSGSLIAVLPMIAPLIANIGVAIANLGPMIGTLAGSTFALAGAFASAGVAAGAFAAVAIPTIKKLFDENAKLNSAQKNAKASFDKLKSTYQGLVKETEKPVLKAFTSAMQVTNTLLTKLRPLFVSSAQAVSSLMTQLNEAIGTPPIQKFLDYLNTTGAPMLKTVARSMGNLLQGVFSMLTAFAPLTASTAKGFEEMTARFAEWSNGLSGSSKFQSFMDYVNTNMPKIRAIFRDATAGIVYFFSAFGGSSSDMMSGLANMMARFKEWSASLSQNQGFQTFLSYVQQTAPSVLQLIGNLAKFLVNLGIGMAPVGAGLMNIVNDILEFINGGMEGNRVIGVLLASFISIGGVLLAVVPNIIAFRELFKGLGPAITGGVGKALKAISGLFTNFSGTMAAVGAKVLSFAKTFGKGLGIITSPVGLVVLAIVGFIAILVRLYQTNEKFRSQVQAVWSAIKTGISIAVTAIKNLVISVWTQITTFWNENQESIKSTASTIWNAIGTVVTTVMSAIGAIMQFIWPVVKALIVSTWEAIKNVIQGAINIILGIIKTFSALFKGDWQGVWDGIKQILSGALQAVWGVVNLYFIGKLLGPLKAFGSTAKTFLQGIWTAIKGIFTNTLNAIKSIVTTTFNGIKTFITSIWNGIKTFFTTVLNGIKTVFTSIWRGIASFLDNLFSSISGLVRAVWNGIKSVISSVLNAIANVVKSIWNGIKNSITSILNGIKSTITSIWNGFKTIVSKAMDNVVTAVKNGWNKAKSFLESISLVKIGEYIVAGLVKGINNWFGKVKAKVAELAELLPAWLRKKLGIHSPSREMAKVAKWIPAGVATGIYNNMDYIKKSAEAMSKAAIPNFQQTVQATTNMMDSAKKILASKTNEIEKEIKAVEAEYAKKKAEATKKSNNKIAEINAKANDKKKKLTAAQQRQILKLHDDEKSALEKIEKEKAKKIDAIRAKSAKEQYDKLKEYAEHQVGLEKWSTKEQAAYWQYATSLFKEGTEERIKAQIEYNKSMAELTTEQFNKEKDYVERRKKYNLMSLTQELAAYEKYVKAYKVGSEERIYYEDKIAETKQAIHDRLMTLNEEYISKIKDVQQAEIDGIKELQKAYQDAEDARAKEIANAISIFDEFERKTDVFGSKLIENLRGQVDAMRDWANDLQMLAAKGVDQGLIAELQAIGPSAQAEIAALNKLSLGELNEYEKLWKEKTQIARERAQFELTGQRKDMADQIEKLQTETKSKLEQYQTEWVEQIKQIREGTKNEFNPMISSMKEIGINAIEGLRNGLASQVPALQAQANEIANTIDKTIRKALQIKSPSRVLEKLGIFSGQGITQGIASTKGMLSNAVKSLTDIMQTDISAASFGLSTALNGGMDSHLLNSYELTSSQDQIGVLKQIAALISKLDFVVKLDGDVISEYVDRNQSNRVSSRRTTIGKGV